jgi:hypothetical protein
MLFNSATQRESSDALLKKWKPILEHEDVGAIKDAYIKNVTAVLLENTENVIKEAAPVNAMGASSSVAGAGAIDLVDPVLISLIRRTMPKLIAYDVCGVQPMTGPTGIVFAMRSTYKTQSGTEAMFNEANTAFSGMSTAGTTGDPYSANAHSGANFADLTANAFTTGHGMTTAGGEALGDAASNAFQQMAFKIDKATVTAKTRALKAEYTTELQQDLKAIHGLDAEKELANLLSTEIVSEINREIIRTIYMTAKNGAQIGTASAGTFNLDTDSNGRWSVEKFKGLLFQLEREANTIAKETRRGRGNIVICSSDVASALSMAGVLDYNPALQNNLNVDDTANTFAGVLNGRMKVYIDPYFSVSANEFAVVGYRGANAYDAGIFYCPYVPLQMSRAMGENTFQPKIAYKTRYGVVANPFVNSAGTVLSNNNVYYRRMAVANLM